MACCGKRAGRVVKTTTANQVTQSFVIADAKTWLPFPRTEKPPGGWDAFGLKVKGPEELAQRLAQTQVAGGTFTNLRAVYKKIKDEYCSRPGAPCGKYTR